MEALKAELAKKREQIANRDKKLANGKVRRQTLHFVVQQQLV